MYRSPCFYAKEHTRKCYNTWARMNNAQATTNTMQNVAQGYILVNAVVSHSREVILILRVLSMESKPNQHAVQGLKLG